jgi:uncharacterized membrane protein YccC
VANTTEWAERTISGAWAWLRGPLVAWGPPLTFGLRLWASVCLALYVAFWLELDNAYWAGTSAALVCQPQLGASLRKGWFRMIGTVVGAVAIVLLAVCFPDDRVPFLIGLALWGGACAFAATVLHNFAGYAAALSGYTVAIIAGDQLGPTGGVNGDIFMLAVFRLSEIAIGIVCAGIVLAGTDLGGARHRLATVFADLTAGIAAGVMRTLVLVGPELPDTQSIRRDFIRRVIALDPLIDQTLGESSQIRYHSPVLQKAVDGLFTSLAGWRAVAHLVVRLPHSRARAEAAAVLQLLPSELLLPQQHGDATRWMADPIRLHRNSTTACRQLVALPADTPSLRLLADKTAEAFMGMAQALNGLALLVRDPARPVHLGMVRLRVPDLLPALINGGRAFVTIGAVALFWIVTAWPNGAGAIVWAAVSVILLSPRADQAYAAAFRFAIGNVLAAVFAAIVAFAVLPKVETFAGFSIALGAYLVPAGALVAQPWQTALFVPMASNFVPLLAPANRMSYDPLQFYNAALALVAGSTVGALAFRLLPPLSPAFRTRRLLALTLRDLRRLASGRTYNDWSSHVHGRLTAMPVEATPLQRAQLLAALSVGTEINQLRHITRRLGFGTILDPALGALALGDSASATAHLDLLEAELAAGAGTGPAPQTVLRARGSILAISGVLTQHAAYFDAGARQ